MINSKLPNKYTKMKNILLIFFLVLTNFVNATNFYVDSSTTLTTQNGSISTPWKTLTQVNSNMSLFQPGDIISFRKGYSYSGQLTVTRSGTAASPIIFNSYGTGEMPKFIGTGSRLTSLVYISNRQYIVFDGIEVTDPTISPTDRTIQSKIERAFYLDGSTNNVNIRNCKINLAGVGVYFVGGNNTLHNCIIENLRMVVNTNDGGFDDYGANPVVISSANNRITNNRFLNCWANSFDFTYDGGAVEFFGPNTNNNIVAYNIMEDNNGLVEFGSSNGGTSSGNIFAYNILINNGSLFYINNSGPFSITATNIQFYNNVIVETVAQRLNESFLFSMASSSANAGISVMKNNIFWITTGIDLARAGQFTGSQLTHNNNIIARASNATAINFAIHPTEIVTTTATQIFKSVSGSPIDWDYNAKDTTSIQVNRGETIPGQLFDFSGDPIVNATDIGVEELQAITPQPPPVRTGYIIVNDKFERLKVLY